MNYNKLYAYVHPLIHLHIVSYHPVYTALHWNAATKSWSLSSFFMKQAALTIIMHHTLTTPIKLNSTPMLIHINGDNESAFNNCMLLVTK